MLGSIKVTEAAVSIFMLKTAFLEGRILLYELHNLTCDPRPKYARDSEKGN